MILFSKRVRKRWYENYRSSSKLSKTQKEFLNSFSEEKFNQHCIDKMYNELIRSDKMWTLPEACSYLGVD